MRWVVGLLLLIAASLKGLQLVIEPATSLVSPLGNWLLPVAVGVEFGMGLWVLTGPNWDRVRWFALLVFVLFTVYSLYLAVGGASSCGCFGLVQVHPWWTFLLDVTVVFGLLVSIYRSQPRASIQAPWTLQSFLPYRGMVAGIVGISLIGTALLVRYADSRSAVAGDLLSSEHGLVILEPDTWKGQRLPIAEAIDVDLTQGQWTVLLHRHDCPDCQAALPQYEQLAIHRPVALIEVPPYADLPNSGSSAALHGRLSDKQEWFVQTPVEIRLTDGIVTSASHELPSLLTASEQ